jgi:hypothetical protein
MLLLSSFNGVEQNGSKGALFNVDLIIPIFLAGNKLELAWIVEVVQFPYLSIVVKEHVN